MKASFANPRGSLRNGQRSRTRLVLDRRQELAVPFTAVTRLAGQPFIYLVGSLAELERRPGKAPIAELRRLPSGTCLPCKLRCSWAICREPSIHCSAARREAIG